MAIRIITIPVGESLPVGEVVKLEIHGRVIGISKSLDAPGWLEASLEISDPAVAEDRSEGVEEIMDRWNQPRAPIRVEERMTGSGF
jgi:hypothetical protein